MARYFGSVIFECQMDRFALFSYFNTIKRLPDQDYHLKYRAIVMF